MTRLSDALAGVSPPPRLPPPPLTTKPANYCGCIKPDDCWGSGGQHFRFFGELDIEREVASALALLPLDPDHKPGDADRARAQVEKTTRQWCSLYVGRHVAYEHCPAFYAACCAEIATRRAREKPTIKRRKDMIAEYDE